MGPTGPTGPTGPVNGGAVDPTPNGLRVTLTSGVPVTTTDVATATTLFVTPFSSGAIALYIGGVWLLKITPEFQLPLGVLQSGKNYDVFAFWNGSVVAAEFSAAWASDTARTDTVTTQDGVTVKASDRSRRLIATIRTISTTQTTDTASQRFVWNGPEASRQVTRPLRVVDTTDSWTHTATGWRQARATASNKVEYVTGSAATLVRSNVYGLFSSTSTTQPAAVGVGVDSTTVQSAQRCGSMATVASTGITPTLAFYEGFPGLGYHTLNWLEWGVNTVTITYYGDNGTATGQTQSGLAAEIDM